MPMTHLRPACRGPWTIAVILAASTTACHRLPAPRVPQLEQAVQIGHGAGERLRAHTRCVEVGGRVEDLVRCMDDEGYDFVSRGTTFPAPECWALRDEPVDGTVPPPHCFEHAPDAPH